MFAPALGEFVRLNVTGVATPVAAVAVTVYAMVSKKPFDEAVAMAIPPEIVAEAG